jgi:hypothetical protein
MSDVIYRTQVNRDEIAAHMRNGGLSAIMDFDHVIEVHEDGTISHPRGVYSPECYVDADADGQVAGEPDVAPWTLLSGYTGQYGYNGPIMHSSEVIGGRMVDDILARPGYYVALVVEVMPHDDEEDPEPAGWAIAYREVGS